MKICKHCNTSFEALFGQRIYCSKKCRIKFHEVKDRKDYTINCKMCDKELNTHLIKQRFCSKKCLKKWHQPKNKEYRIKNKPSLFKKYGIKVDEYNRIYNNQNGCCKICGIHQSELNVSLAVDHCHVTNEVRGLLCRKCNTGLGFFNDNETILDKAIRYLKEARN